MLPILLALAAPLPATTVAAPRCRPAALAVTSDGRDGDLDGMSHGGSYLVVRNRGRVACAVDALPVVKLLDRRGRALPIARQVPPGMHPGPVMVPVQLAPGQRAETPLRWVSGAVYDKSRCFDVARAAVTINGAQLRLPLQGHICGQAGTAITFEQRPLARPGA